MTGIYNRNKLQDEIKKLRNAHKNTEFAVLRFDISKFSLVNSFYGQVEGNKLLIYIAKCIKETAEAYGNLCRYGRLEADIFGICVAFESKEKIEADIEKFVSMLKFYKSTYVMLPCFGIYVVDERKKPFPISVNI